MREGEGPKPVLRNLTAVAAVLVFILIGLIVRDQMGMPSKTLTIFYTSNLRGQISPFTGDLGDRQNMKTGGFAFIKGLINDTIRRFRLNPQRVLLLDTGDALFGSAEASLTLGEAPFQLMVYMGYDAMAVGNMEFEYGIDTLRRFADSEKLPMLACNYRDLKSPVGNTFLPGKIIDKDGTKVGVIGLGHADLARNTRRENLLQIEIIDMQSSVQKTAALLKNQGAELMILLSHHPGLDERQDLGILFPDIDIVIGDVISTFNTSATQRPLVCPTAFSRGAGLGLIKIPCVQGKWLTAKALRTVLPVDVDNIVPDPDLVNEISKTAARVDTLLEKVICEAVGDFKKAYNDESTIGNLVTDAMRATAKTAIGFQNSGGIKIAFAKGFVALRDLYEMIPFENSIARLDLFGWQIEDMLESSLSGRTSFLQSSGISCTYSSANPPGFRIIQIGVNDEPLEWNNVYSVAANDFMLENHMNWPELSRGTNVAMIGQLRESLKTYIEAAASITPSLEKRFHDVKDSDPTLCRQALEIEIATLSHPVTHTPDLNSEYGSLVTDMIRREADVDFVFLSRDVFGTAPGTFSPLEVVTPARILQDLPIPAGVETLVLPGATVQKIIEAGIASASRFCFSGLSIETRDGKLSRLFPWEGDFDPVKTYKVAILQNFPLKVDRFYDIKDRKRTVVFSDFRRAFLLGVRRLAGNVEIRRAVY
jgi:2',3'-cyclic-nucleotide 2'-phosphodiesterase (5'-nucleotidase family)